MNREERIPLAWVIGSNIRHLREERGWSQSRLAGEMARVGFRWHQSTVSEVEPKVRGDGDEESVTRGLRIEELFALAVAFGVPLARLLIPDTDTEVSVGELSLPPETLTALLRDEGDDDE